MVLVVKAGGRVVEENVENLIQDIVELMSRGVKVVFVHGGGSQVSEYSRKMGIEPRIIMHPSRMRSRYTSLEELEVFTMVMAGLINKNIVSRLESRGVRALGVTGADLGLVRAERKRKIIIVNEKGRKQVIPGGFTGRITSVSGNDLRGLLDLTGVLIVSPLALGLEGELLNVDGDQMAAKIASALKAESLVLLSDVPGVILDGEMLESITPDEARALYDRIGPGMNRKVMMAAEAVEKGVGIAVIGSGLSENPVSNALNGKGTRITL
ncbi:MAG: [LysW]-aminoadipate/[LysW]-glutamate kinase [Desulfurococcales archaeon]|nr:[LysW]-aminoadipate/[LysW]-glutamate kinase [Desulfurococcales archaeon]